MLNNAARINCYVDWTPDGSVMLTPISDDDDLDSLLLRFDPGSAHRLAQMLTTAAEVAMDIRQEQEQPQ